MVRFFSAVEKDCSSRRGVKMEEHEGGTPKAIAGVPMEYRPRGLTDVKKQVSSIKGMLMLSTLALVVLTASSNFAFS